MREPASPHGLRIFLAHSILVAGDERLCDRSASAGEAFSDVTAQPLAKRVQPVPGTRIQNGDRTKRAADGANATEPCVAGEIMRSRNRHRRRRGESGAEPDRSASAETGRGSIPG